MLVQALAEYAYHYLAEELNDKAWEMKPVPWLIEISRQGTFLNVTPRMKTETRRKKQVQVPVEMSVPRSPVNRNNGDHPLVATDGIAYVLGVGAWTEGKARKTTEEHHSAFVALLRQAANATQEPSVQACLQFYANSVEVERARKALADCSGSENIALSVGGPLVEIASIKEFWRKHYDAKSAEALRGTFGECMISGVLGPIPNTHHKIKGLANLGGRAEVGLMSFDKPAFQSYGWEQNRNSPISSDRALAYVLAFNDLLKLDKGRRKDIAGIGFLYWLRNPADMDAMGLMDRADPEQVKKLLSFDPQIEPDSNRFYMVAVSGNGGRLRVRHWADLALNQAKANLQNWHRQLCVEYPLYDGQEPPPVRLWQLLYALDREGEPDDQTVLALLRRGIEGLPLGYSVLSKALSRLRHPGGLDSKAKDKAGENKSDPMSLSRLRIPMGLIRMSLNDLIRQQEGAREMSVKEISEGLDTNCNLPAYVCGRLMAEFESLQRASSESELNSSVLDRYFALASTYPAVAFPKIESLGQKHLRKLRRDKPRVAYAIDMRLQQLHSLLQPSEAGAYPAKLGLEGQGLFALGYYHQKARSSAEAQSRKQGNESTNSQNFEEKSN